MIEEGDENALSLSMFWKKNTFDKPFYPTKGISINTSLGYHFVNELSIKYYPEAPSNLPASFNTDPYFLAEAEVEYVLPISKRLRMPIKAQIRYATEAAQGLNQQVGVGGFFNNYETTMGFWGALFYEFQVHSFTVVQASFQYDLSRSLLLIARVNYLNTEYPITLWDDGYNPESLNNGNDIFGWGIGVVYKSILGPIQFIAGSSDYTSKWTRGISLGFWH